MRFRGNRGLLSLMRNRHALNPANPTKRTEWVKKRPNLPACGHSLVEQIEQKKELRAYFGHRVLRPTADINEGIGRIKTTTRQGESADLQARELVR
jgi:hypothetical protein